MPQFIIHGPGDVSPLEFDAGVVYRWIPGFPGYVVGDDGSLWSNRKVGWRRRKVSIWPPTPKCSNPYPFVSISKSGDTRQIYLQRLVLMVFTGPPPAGTEARHLNGNRFDCRYVNLAWGTIEQNTADKFIHGTIGIGVKNGRARLTEAAVSAIRADAAAGVAQCVLAIKYNAPRVTINHIVRRYTWKHIA